MGWGGVFVGAGLVCGGGGGGLFYPSTVLVDFATCLESVFREQVPLAIHRPKISLHFMSKVKDASSISSITCLNIVCTSAYFIVRIHHFLREKTGKYSALMLRGTGKLDASLNCYVGIL